MRRNRYALPQDKSVLYSVDGLEFVETGYSVGDDGADDWVNVSEMLAIVVRHAAAKKFETVSTGKKPLLYATSASSKSLRHFQSPV